MVQSYHLRDVSSEEAVLKVKALVQGHAVRSWVAGQHGLCPPGHGWEGGKGNHLVFKTSIVSQPTDFPPASTLLPKFLVSPSLQRSGVCIRNCLEGQTLTRFSKAVHQPPGPLSSGPSATPLRRVCPKELKTGAQDPRALPCSWKSQVVPHPGHPCTGEWAERMWHTHTHTHREIVLGF